MAQATQFPGLSGMIPQGGAQSEATNQKAIMGFLFSVSKSTYGEFWPVYVGANSIGRGPANSVNLQEQSVSANHAQLIVRAMLKDGVKSGVLAFVKDEGSVYGTQVNGETLGFEPATCKTGDIITIGSCYELLFIQVDADSLGLKTKADFQPVVAEVAPAPMPNPTPNPNPAPRKGTVGMTQAMNNQPSSNQENSRPSTVYMPNQSAPNF